MLLRLVLRNRLLFLPRLLSLWIEAFPLLSPNVLLALIMGCGNRSMGFLELGIGFVYCLESVLGVGADVGVQLFG